MADKKKEKITKTFDEKEFVETLQRLQAEFENYKKRTENEKSKVLEYAKVNLLLKLINLNDDFDRTLTVIDTADIKTVKDGIEMISNQVKKILHEEGVEAINCVGEKLDPFKHEVLLNGESDKEDNTIIEEFQKGYLFKGSVLRASKVKVCKNNSKTQEGK
ncbi:nucleotide exchange factor GrpE [Candidatus Woesearchaeota archaeon]|nr:nucleotide exchange factor GrpE [Candidatus Woesearchaeota archaeon]